MFGFAKKEKMNEERKNLIKQVMMFYEINKDLFIDYSNQKEKKQIISSIFKSMKYDNYPKLSSLTEQNIVSNIVVYRGISALNEDLLKEYIDAFINGEVFLGGRASIYGTGIYTFVGSLDVAKDYSSDGGQNNCGVIIESRMANDTKIIEVEKLEELKEFLINNLKNIYGKTINNYINIIDDNGALATILGYDAIYVKDKNYLVVLNRTKMIVNDVDLYKQLDNIKNDNYRSNSK